MSRLDSRGHQQRRPVFKRKQGTQVLTRSKVRQIKAGRKKLRRQMRKQGLRSRRDFETTASSLGLYFDKLRLPPFLAWLFSRGAWRPCWRRRRRPWQRCFCTPL